MLRLGFCLHLPQTLEGLKNKSLQISQTLGIQQETISTWKKRIHSRKSRCVMVLNIALICSKYKVGHSRFSSDGKQFRHTRLPCSQHFSEHPVRGICLHKWWLTSNVGGICGGKAKSVCVLSVLKFSVCFHSYFIKT